MACDLGQQKKTTLKGRPNSPICVYYDVYPSDDLIVYNIYHSPVCVVNKDPISISAEGTLEVKLPTVCRDGKAEVGRISEEKSRSEKIRDGESQKKEDARARKVGKSRFTMFFPMICGSGGSKSNLAKAAGAEPAGQMRDEKLHAVVARSTFPS